MLPKEFPPWQTVYYHFRKWRRLNLLQWLCDRIRRAARVSEGRRPSPSAAAGDTQSARAERQGGPSRGRDPSKQVTGRKRHVIARALRLFLGVLVHPANEHDSQMAPFLLHRILGKVPRLKVIFADGGYKGLPGGLLWRQVHWLISVEMPRLRLIIICSGIPRRTPRGSWLEAVASEWLAFFSHRLPGAAAPSGGGRSARPYFGRGTSGHPKSADAPDRLGCFHVPGSLTRCLCPRTTAGSNRHRRPGRPWAASGRFRGRPRGRGTDTSPVRLVKKADSWR